jgi:flagellar assembly protein FliH
MATVIKGGLRGQAGTALTFEDLQSLGGQRPEDGCEAAAALLAAARSEADDIRAQALREGREAGRDEARRLADAQAAGVVAAVQPLVQQVAGELAQLRQTWLAQWERQAVRLATGIAERIVRRELERQPEICTALVAEALELVAGKPDLRIVLNPEDFRAHGETISRLATELAGVARSAVVADPSVSRGGCRVETSHGVVDQTLEAQLARIERELIQP